MQTEQPLPILHNDFQQTDEASCQHSSPTRIICIAIDHSEYAMKAFLWAKHNFLRKESDQIILINVRPDSTTPIFMNAPFTDLTELYADVDSENRRNSHDLIRKFAGDLSQHGFKVRGVALRGDPREEIVHYVQEVKADALVIGSRGLGTLKKVFVGSVSDFCVKHCHCIVIVHRN